MAPDPHSVGIFCDPGVYCQHVGNVHANVADGLDDVEGLHGDISGRSGVPVLDHTGAMFSVEAILQECLEGNQA